MATPDDFTGPLNIGNPNEFTIAELADHVLNLTRSKSKLVNKSLPSDDPRQRQPDIGLADEVINWKPTIELREGLKRTIAYFREQFESDEAALAHLAPAAPQKVNGKDHGAGSDHRAA